MSDDEGPPPLEDISSELLKKPAPKPIVSVSSNEPSFSGLRGGFFNTSRPASSSTKPSASATTAPTAVDTMKSEIGKAINESAPASWLTGDLLERLMANPSLAAGFQNPRIMAAIQELGKDPKGALAKYQGDAEVDKFLRCVLLPKKNFFFRPHTSPV